MRFSFSSLLLICYYILFSFRVPGKGNRIREKKNLSYTYVKAGGDGYQQSH